MTLFMNFKTRFCATLNNITLITALILCLIFLSSSGTKICELFMIVKQYKHNKKCRIFFASSIILLSVPKAIIHTFLITIEKAKTCSPSSLQLVVFLSYDPVTHPPSSSSSNRPDTPHQCRPLTAKGTWSRFCGGLQICSLFNLRVHCILIVHSRSAGASE